jgi:hypothetical protein
LLVVQCSKLMSAPAQKRLTQVSGHLAGSTSIITPTEALVSTGGRAKILEKNPDDVSLLPTGGLL